MRMIRKDGDGTISLSNGSISYLMRVADEGILEHCYFGAAVDADSVEVPRRSFRWASTNFQAVEHYCLADIPQEYPLFGTSDMRQPALHLKNADGNCVNCLLYKGHEIVIGKPQLAGLPSARGDQSETLIVELEDSVAEFSVFLHYTIYAEHDVIARSSRVVNRGAKPLQLEQVFSSSIDFTAEDYDVLHLRGSWSQEFNRERHKIPFGRFAIESNTGASSNQHSPFIALLEPETSEHQGAVWGSSLIYSGNFRIGIERGEFGSVRQCVGINPFNFNWTLDSGESFQTPEALHVYSNGGLNGMSQIWHAFIRQQILPSRFSHQPRPSYLNSWESAYFDIDETLVLELAKTTKSLGLQMLVVDDGWFGERHDDTTSLGDWTPNPRKFPRGIQAVAEEVCAMGIRFGLWVEPEMTNERSELYNKHPEWVIQVPNRPLSTGRNQLILDLTRPQVVDYLYQQIDALLAPGNISYIKWDMNRTMTELGSLALPKAKQLETAHRYMLGLYQLLQRITEAYPEVLFENCASGGNRFDLGMLRYMAQGWLSDMSEPIGRLAITQGASLIFPLSVIASYIGPVPSHQNGRLVSLNTRATVGFFAAARGLSLNQEDIELEKAELKKWVASYNDTSADAVTGRFYRLSELGNSVCWQLSSADGERIYLGYFHILSTPNLPLKKSRLVHLDADARYVRDTDQRTFQGNTLMHAGVDLPIVHVRSEVSDNQYMDAGDFSAHLMVFSKYV